ncbi:MAG: amidohydrolase [Bacilli bacterium]|nr:amidohydrolase [Bacilli bacterium]
MKNDGKTFKYPAFFDGHLHFLGIGIQASIVNLDNSSSVAEVISRLKTSTSTSEIIGRGWNQMDFDKAEMPLRIDLDKVSTAIPVIAYRVCGHVAVVNSHVCQRLEKLVGNAEIFGGSIDYESGLLTENALRFLRKITEVPSRQKIESYLETANKLLLECGLTKVMSDDFQTLPVPYTEIIDIINDMYSNNRLQIRIIEQVHLPSLELLKDFIARGYSNKDFGPWKLGPLKLLADGSLGARTARLLEPYEDAPNETGILTFSDQALKEIFDLANANELDCHVHAIGDGAIKQILDVMEASLIESARKDHRHAIIHAQLARSEDIQRMRALQIGAIVQPIFLETDIGMVDDRIGKRKEDAYRFKTMHDNNVVVGFSTDSPVESYDPLKNLYAAVSRSSNKYPQFSPYLPTEGFSVDTALICYKQNNEYLAREEASSDWVLLDTDIKEVDPKSILKAKVLATAIKDKVVFERTNVKEG